MFPRRGVLIVADLVRRSLLVGPPEEVDMSLRWADVYLCLDQGEYSSRRSLRAT